MELIPPILEEYVTLFFNTYMRTTKQILPGVKEIGWVRCEHLVNDIALRGIAMMPVPVLTQIHNVPFFDEPTCECVTENDGGNRTDTAKLKFASEDLLPLKEHLAFVVTAIDGNSYIIGARETPFPVVKLTISFGNTDGDGAGFIYEITHKAIKSLVPCHK